MPAEKKEIKKDFVLAGDFISVDPKLYEAIKGIGVLSSEMIKGVSGLGEMASALSVGVPMDILGGYKGIIASQNEILKSVGVFQEHHITGQMITDMGKVNHVLGPMAESVLDLGLGAANASKLFSDGIISKINFSEIQKISGIAIEALKENQNYFSTTFEKMGSLSNFIQDPSVLSIPMAAAGVDIMTRAMPTFPTIELPTLDKVREVYVFDEPKVKKVHKTLDNLLKNIKSELVEMRKGCWQTFESKKSDYIRQSSSSMRGLVDTLLREIAPDEEVVKTDYFDKSPKAKTEKGLPTRKARIYYAMNYDEKRAEHLERLAVGLDEFQKNLSAWDHKPLDNDQFVYGSFIAIEGFIFALLAEKREEK